MGEFHLGGKESKLLREIQNAVDALRAVPEEFRSLVLAELGAVGKKRGPKPGFKRTGKKPGPKPGSKRTKAPIMEKKKAANIEPGRVD